MDGKRSSAALRKPLERVVLTGFMGSGKTTVGRLLAVALGWDFADLDEQIVERCALSVPEIFARFGEPRFREEESRALADCLRRKRLVLALGGGAPELADNRVLLAQNDATLVVFLAGDFETLHARCVAQSADPRATARPVMADVAAARKRFQTRAPLYAELADLTLETATHSAQELVAEITSLLRPERQA